MIHEYSVPTFVFFTVLLIGWYFISRVQTNARLKKLGDKPVLLPYKWPFGFDMLLEGIEVDSIMLPLTLVQS
jgi:hypothetical protein